jgi:hypothetical protein
MKGIGAVVLKDHIREFRFEEYSPEAGYVDVKRTVIGLDWTVE